MGGLSFSHESDAAFDDNGENIMSFEEFEKAYVLNAQGGGDGSGGADTAQQHATRTAAATGISWRSLMGDVLTQPLFFGFFSLIATPAIRESRAVSRSTRTSYRAESFDHFTIVGAS